VGSFTPENNYALSVHPDTWPQIDQGQEWIEIGFLTAHPPTAPIELIHVSGTREVERWKLQIPITQGMSPVCKIATLPESSNCGAVIHVRPQNMLGYYYLRTNGEPVVEAGMSFKLCPLRM